MAPKPEDDSDSVPSKSERKRHSTDLQALGETLIELPQPELDALELPEILRDAVQLARRITAHGGLYRQKQYIGKIMRKIDAEPIRVALQARHEQERVAALRFRRLEQWRERLLTEGRPAFEQFVLEHPQADTALLQRLVETGIRERERQLPPRALRELFVFIRELGE